MRHGTGVTPAARDDLLQAVRAVATTAAGKVFLALTLLPAGVTHAAAPDYPLRPLRIVVTNTAGSGADVVTRLVGDRLTQAWGQQVVIDNRAGASGNIGAEIVARAAPDGYTLLMITSQQANAAALSDKLAYNVIKDFAPVGLFASTPLILVVNAALPAANMRELIALAKAKPGQINYGSPGVGTASHLAAELLRSMSGIEIVHVPYKGTPQALTDTMAGQLQLSVLVATAVIPSLKGGKIRALGVTSAKRSPLAPELPAIAETVPGYEWTGWYGLAAPAGTPREIIARLNAAQLDMLKNAEMRERLADLGADAIGSTPQEYAEHIRRQIEKMRQTIRSAGIKLE
jgi:tripartite-type tricarboxylate transporter receptor subunit TctC